MTLNTTSRPHIRTIAIPPLGLEGLLRIPDGARGVVAFAHGSGSSRMSPRNNHVAEALGESRIATLLFDLLLPEEEADRANVFDIAALSKRLDGALDWLREDRATHKLLLGLFGASTGAAAALVTAADRHDVSAVVSRGGRPDLAGEALDRVAAPTLLIVGGRDEEVLALNRAALARLRCKKALRVIPGATHLFEEPGALDQVVEMSRTWFEHNFGG